ncbi:MAG: DUF3857 domain-containing protein [Chitinophagaceae bacterium]|nr:DUF3857 domain-containing protein [Chitinophagaceae bacterium]
MKKRNLFIFSALLISSAAFSQFSQQFGELSAEEVNMKQCSFDPEASAAVLLDAGNSWYNDDDALITYYHRRIKILKDDGIEYGDVKLSFYSDNNFEYIDRIEGVTINPDGKGGTTATHLDPKSIFVRKLNKYRSEVSFAMPNVKAGSIIEYQYHVTAKSYSGLRDWSFQDEIPVYFSKYKLDIVPGREISYLVQYNPKFKVGVDNDKANHAISFSMNNIPGLTDEPYMDARQDYIQKVIFQTTKYMGHVGQVNFMSTWKEVTRELMSRSDFGKQMRLEIDECRDFVAQTVAGKSDSEKIQLIHDYVASNLTWDRVYALTAEAGIKNLWKKKTGNSAEINLLLINLLKAAGLEAYPILVSERGHGRINKDQPFINQFSNVFAVVFSGGKKYYLDATDQFTPSHLIPYSILNSTGFIVDNKIGGLIDIAEEQNRYSDFINILTTINENGEMKGSVHNESRDYARTEKLRDYFGHKNDYVDNYIKKGMVNVAVENFKVINQDEERLPLTQQFDFSSNIQSTGDYSFINLNMFTGLESNPFIINERFSNINFGYKKSLQVKFTINLPPNFKVDALPKNIQLVNNSRTVTFTRQMFQEKSQLLAVIKVDINKSIYNINEYPEVKDFFKQMINLMNEQVVLKKL